MATWKKIVEEPTTGTASSSTFLRGDGAWATPAYTTNTNTWRGVTAGGNTLASNESLDFVAGSNITISESGGDVTIAAASGTDTNTTYTIADNGLNEPDFEFTLTPSTGSATNITIEAGTNCSFDYDSGWTLNCTDTNTTYSNSSWDITALGGYGGGTINFLRADGSWASPPNTNTTYSAGAGLDLSSTTFSVESDLRSDVYKIGRDTNDYYAIETTTHDWYLDGVLDMRLENDGDLHVEKDVIAYSGTTASDKRLKTKITNLENKKWNCLKKIDALRPVKFTWKVNDKNKDIGLIANEVQKVIPEVVKEKTAIGETRRFLKTDTMLTISYEKLVPILIGAVQELKAEIDILKGKK
jgi:hypothetical protein|tara:strand:- start:9183 stop:10250 length:1068 start_codon:yes stop_codon:yes gene_type:complete